ncbi:MAG: S8 family peptidase [Chloroflexota bacterium]|nr:S8 family peptidase [Chloroflexota bacterium]
MPNPAKIHANLSAHMQVRALALGAQPLRVIVKYRAGVLGALSAVAGVMTTQYTFRLISASAHSVTPDAVNALSERDDVEMIWYDEPVHTMLDQSVPLIGAPNVWQAGFTGKGIKVGIVDTGIDPDHPDFAGRIVQMKDFTGQGPNDNHGHGTHVAGIIGGSGAASNGKYKGVAPECVYYTAKVLRGDGSGSTSDVMAGVEWATQQNVQVINLSLGSDGACDGTDALSVTCDAAMNRGVVVCIAAGNAGPGAGTVGSPGCAKAVITIGATTKTDQVADFSSRGPTSDGRVKPDVCFPGASIHACRAKGTSMGTPVDDYYTTASGTSMATPHAAGTCALLLQAKPTLSPQQVKDLLTSTAKNLALDPNTQGTGRADDFTAYQKALGAPPPPPPQPPPPPPGGCLELIKSLLGGR